MTSLTLPEESVLLKQDERGRILMPAERREAILDEFARCGMSGAAFARQHGIKYQTFMAWCARRRRGGAAAPRPAALTLAEVIVAGASRSATPPEPGLRISLPGGATMHICRPEDGVLAATILQALGQRSAGC